MVYAAREEMCENAVDFLARRTRLAFLDIRAAEEALPRVRVLLEYIAFTPPPFTPAACACALPKCLTI